MKSKDIRKEKPSTKLQTIQIKEGDLIYYIFYNDQSAKVKRRIDGQFYEVGIYKPSKRLWIHGKQYHTPMSIKVEVEKLYP